MMEEHRTTVLIRIEQTLREQLQAMAKPLWDYGGDHGPKEPIGRVIQRLVGKAGSSRAGKPRRPRRRRRR